MTKLPPNRATDDKDWMRAMLEAFAARPEVPTDKMPPLLNPNQGQCEHCKKFLPLTKMPVINTGLVQVQQPLCPDCCKTFKDQAKVVCVNCRVVVLWVDPYKEKNTGFQLEKSKYYHVKNCPVCSPGLTEAPILEKIVYYRKNNIPFE